MNYSSCCAELTLLKRDEDHQWLNDCDATALQSELQHLDEAFKKFFSDEARIPNLYRLWERSTYDRHVGKSRSLTCRRRSCRSWPDVSSAIRGYTKRAVLSDDSDARYSTHSPDFTPEASDSGSSPSERPAISKALSFVMPISRHLLYVATFS